MPSPLRKFAKLAASVAAWLGSLYITRWLLGVGKPRDDTRPLRNLWQDVRWAWAHRDTWWHRLNVRVDSLLGLTDVRLALLKARILAGFYRDDTQPA